MIIPGWLVPNETLRRAVLAHFARTASGAGFALGKSDSNPICDLNYTGQFANGLLNRFPVEIREDISRKSDVPVLSRDIYGFVANFPPKNAARGPRIDATSACSESPF